MAVIIDVPGIGKVVAENAAEEETMKQILAAILKSEKTKRKEEKDLIDAQKKQVKATKDSNEGLERLKESTDDVQKAQVKAKQSTDSAGQAFVNASKQTASAAGDFAKTLGLTAVSIAASFAKNYDAIGQNPIDAGAALLNTGIDLAAKGVTVVTSGVKAVGSALGGIPIIGPVINGFVSGAAEAANAAAQLAAELAKAANQILANELKKSIESMNTLAKAGASFGGGLTEMRTIANQSGLDLKTFSTVVSSAREDIGRMGLSASEGAKQLSGGLSKLATTTGSSGNTLRNELLAIGYGYEEQGAILAQYTAQLNSSGKLRSMSDAEIAKGTVQYGKDLKVLADITGQDAKKALEDARKKSMEADILAQLSPEEAEKFKRQMAAMPENAKKGFLEFVSSGGTAVTDQQTNILMAQEPKLRELYEQQYATLKDRNKNETQAQDESLKLRGELGQSLKARAKDGEFVINQAARMGAQGLQGQADMVNGMIDQTMVDPSQVEKSRKAVDAQASATDAATQGYIEAYDAAKKFQVEMEQLATKYLPEYSKLLATALKETTEMLGKVAGNNKSSEEDAKAKANEEQIKKEYERLDKVATEAENKFREAISGSFTKKLGIGLTDEEKSLRDEAQRLRLEASGNYDGLQDAGIQQYSKGGIASGPMSGFAALLHGTEAVVPLPDGKSIPIELPKIPEAMSGGKLNPASSISSMMGSFGDIMKDIGKPFSDSDDSPITDMSEKMQSMFKDSFGALTGTTAESGDIQKQMLDVMQRFTEKMDTVERHLYDQKTLQQRLVDNT